MENQSTIKKQPTIEHVKEAASNYAKRVLGNEGFEKNASAVASIETAYIAGVQARFEEPETSIATSANEYILEELGEDQFKKNKMAVRALRSDFKAGYSWAIQNGKLAKESGVSNAV